MNFDLIEQIVKQAKPDTIAKCHERIESLNREIGKILDDVNEVVDQCREYKHKVCLAGNYMQKVLDCKCDKCGDCKTILNEFLRYATVNEVLSNGGAEK